MMLGQVSNGFGHLPSAFPKVEAVSYGLGRLPSAFEGKADYGLLWPLAECVRRQGGLRIALAVCRACFRRSGKLSPSLRES